VVAEVDHLAGARAGNDARDAWRSDLLAGAYRVAWWPHAEAQIVEIASTYRDLGVDLTDASLIALADRLGSADIATIDERHFRAVRPLSSADAFRLLPADA
jgi:predicted nucleic acid-binding protein